MGRASSPHDLHRGRLQGPAPRSVPPPRRGRPRRRAPPGGRGSDRRTPSRGRASRRPPPPARRGARRQAPARRTARPDADEPSTRTRTRWVTRARPGAPDVSSCPSTRRATRRSESSRSAVRFASVKNFSSDRHALWRVNVALLHALAERVRAHVDGSISSTPASTAVGQSLVDRRTSDRSRPRPPPLEVLHVDVLMTGHRRRGSPRRPASACRGVSRARSCAPARPPPRPSGAEPTTSVSISRPRRRYSIRRARKDLEAVERSYVLGRPSARRTDHDVGSATGPAVRFLESMPERLADPRRHADVDAAGPGRFRSRRRTREHLVRGRTSVDASSQDRRSVQEPSRSRLSSRSVNDVAGRGRPAAPPSVWRRRPLERRRPSRRAPRRRARPEAPRAAGLMCGSRPRPTSYGSRRTAGRRWPRGSDQGRAGHAFDQLLVGRPRLSQPCVGVVAVAPAATGGSRSTAAEKAWPMRLKPIRSPSTNQRPFA